MRGHRVDLAGVEAALATCPAIADACVFEADDAVWACVVSTGLSNP